MSNPDKFFDGIGKALEIAPELYNDGLKNTVIQTGKNTERIPRFINALAADFDIWIMNREAKVAMVSKLIDEKLKNVDEHKIQKPEPHIAIPALQAIAYSMDSDELRNLYANLLAKSMNIETCKDVHPAFVTTIAQMTPRDVSNLSVFPNNFQPLPIANYFEKIINSDGYSNGYNVAFLNIFLSNPQYNDLEEQASSVTHLDTLGLLRIESDTSVNTPNIYSPFYDTKIYKELLKTKENRNQYIASLSNDEYIALDLDPDPDPSIRKKADVEVVKEVIRLTPFGLHFKQVCYDA